MYRNYVFIVLLLSIILFTSENIFKSKSLKEENEKEKIKNTIHYSNQKETITTNDPFINSKEILHDISTLDELNGYHVNISDEYMIDGLDFKFWNPDTITIPSSYLCFKNILLYSKPKLILIQNTINNHTIDGFSR